MIARGDLAAEIGFERLAEMQEEILWICEAAGVPAIWATQVLEDLVKSGVPSRGEMTDAAMAARAECVMLNKGPAVGAAIDVLDRSARPHGRAPLQEDADAARAEILVSDAHTGGRIGSQVLKKTGPRTAARGHGRMSHQCPRRPYGRVKKAAISVCESAKSPPEAARPSL